MDRVVAACPFEGTIMVFTERGKVIQLKRGMAERIEVQLILQLDELLTP